MIGVASFVLIKGNAKIAGKRNGTAEIRCAGTGSVDATLFPTHPAS